MEEEERYNASNSPGKGHTAIILSLQDLLAQRDEPEIVEILSTFRCSRDEDIEHFLHVRAIEFERLAKSKTYLICDGKALGDGEFRILEYFALSLKVLILPDGLSIRGRKEIDGFRGKIYGRPVREIPCYLIGQLGRNSNVGIGELSGKELMDAALYYINLVVEAVGGRWVLVECHNEDALIRYYMENNFSYVMDEPDEDIPMVQMIRKV